MSLCTEVVDGDSFHTADGEKIRLEGVNCPEKGKPGWERAKSALERLVLNKVVRYEGVARDTWGRVVARVWVDGVDVNEAMRRVCP